MVHQASGSIRTGQPGKITDFRREGTRSMAPCPPGEGHARCPSSGGAAQPAGDGQSDSRWHSEHTPWMTRLWSVIVKPFWAAMLRWRCSMVSSRNSVTRPQRTQTR